MDLRNVISAVLLILLIQSLTLSGQQKYADAAFYKRSLVFNETFDNNNKNWITDNSWINGRFDNGHYILKCKNFHGLNGLSYKAMPLDQSRDFEIEATLEILKGSGGLIFGMTDKYEHYRIEITHKNDLAIIKNTPSKNKIEKLLTVSDNPLFSPGSPVKVTIRKFNNIYSIFINESLIKEFNNIKPEGKLVGFNVGRNSEVSVDYLSVSYLENRTIPQFANRTMETKDTVSNLPPAEKSIGQPKTENKQMTLSSAPVITWISPSGFNTPLDYYSAKIKVNILSATDLKTVLVYINGTAKGECDTRAYPGENGRYISEKNITFDAGENTVYLIATNNAGSTRSELRHFSNPSATRPVIIWGNPVKREVVVNTESFTIEACVNSPSGLKSAKVLVNAENQGEDNIFRVTALDSCNIKYQRPITLKQGENRIYIYATNAAGTERSEYRIINYQPTLAEKRIALVIGNSDYVSKTSLKNPVNDANLMEATLKQLGFEIIIKRLDSGRDSMISSIREFSRKLSGYNVALFYYAGHGIQVDGINYLIPTDAELKNKDDCKYEAIEVNFVTDEFKKYPTNTNIVILDACRNNPYRTWARGGASGFKALAPINGTIISFATSEGTTAADGSSANGLFTEELVKQMIIPQPIESVFKKTRKQVIELSNGQQTPTEWSYLIGDFYFKK